MQYKINFLSSLFKSKYRIIMMQALSVLDCDKETIRKKFPHNYINVISDPLDIDKELLEIRFKNMTVTYAINSEDICYIGYLFLDDFSELVKFSSVCSKYFKRIAHNTWKHKDRRIELMKEGADFYFAFSM